MKYWLVGAFRSKEDYSVEYISNGYWENGYDDKFADLVNSIREGDKIAIKSTYTRKHRLPFNGHGNTVSCMNIKAAGTVLRNHNNGRRVEVKWDNPSLNKVWYFFTYWWTITKVAPSDGWMHQHLVDFIFNGKGQDIKAFRNAPYWRDKYGDFLDQDTVLNDHDLITAVTNTQPQTEEREAVDSKKAKSELVSTPVSKEVPRDVSVARNALRLADYCCEYDRTHTSFRKKTPPHLTYTEPHHLIPLSAYNEFDYSLDVEANICSLCSTCHNCLHYGIAEERDPILRKLFYERRQRLKNVGLEVSLAHLKQCY